MAHFCLFQKALISNMSTYSYNLVERMIHPVGSWDEQLMVLFRSIFHFPCSFLDCNTHSHHHKLQCNAALGHLLPIVVHLGRNDRSRLTQKWKVLLSG